MDDLGRFVVRMLGDSPAAHAAEEQARSGADGERSAMLRAAVAAVRQGAEPASEPKPTAPAATDDAADRPTDPAKLADAVAGELEAATNRLPAEEREALALRELLGLSYEEIADAAGVERDAVAPLLARARLDLRAALRGAGQSQPACDERERALRTIALRQDGEAVPAADDDWLIDHLGHCRGCRQSHAAMLEASACYRAWAAPEVPSDPVAGTGSVS